MPITIKDIARIAGVSIGTVSLSLNNDPRVSDKTKAQIQKISAENNYIPSNLGRALQSKKSSLIACLISDIKDSFYNQILHGIGMIAKDNNYGLLVGVTEDSKISELSQLKIFQEKMVEGIILSNYNKENIPYIQKIKESGIPIVISDFESIEGIPNVMLDDEKACNLIMDHLTSLGHKDITYCYGINSNSMDRFNYCIAYAKKHNLIKPTLCFSEVDLEIILRKGILPTAIICYSDNYAIKIKHKLEEFNISVPKDISIVGFDDMDFASWKEFSLTTISQPKTDIGKLSATLLFEMIKKENISFSHKIEPTLIIRNSTEKVRGS